MNPIISDLALDLGLFALEKEFGNGRNVDRSLRRQTNHTGRIAKPIQVRFPQREAAWTFNRMQIMIIPCISEG